MTYRFRAIAFLQLALVCMLLSSLAIAADAYRTALAEAVAAKERALDSGDQADWRDVLLRLRFVESIRVTAESKYELGYAAAQLEDIGPAIEAYYRAIELGLNGRARDKAQQYLKEHEATLARLLIHGPAGWLLTIDGIERGRLPLETPLWVNPGTVRVDIYAPPESAAEGVTGSASLRHLEQQLELRPGELTEFELPVNRIPTIPEPTTVSTSLSPSGAETMPPFAARVALGEPETLDTAALRTSQRDRQVIISNKTAWALTSGGVTSGILSALMLPLVTARLSQSEQVLRDSCAKQVDGPNTCKHAKVGKWAVAQSAADSIATWRAARTVSWGALIGSVATVAVGVSILLFNESPQTKAPIEAQLIYDNAGFQLGVGRAF